MSELKGKGGLSRWWVKLIPVIVCGITAWMVSHELAWRRISPPSEPRALLALCENHRYETKTVSVDPLVIYVDGFLHPEEIRHLLALSRANYKTAMLDTHEIDTTFRSASSAFLPPEDEVVTCIRQRAIDFNAFLDVDDIAPLQLVRYTKKQAINMHYDWRPYTEVDDRNRHFKTLSSFFVYLDANCTGGGTYFPRLHSPSTIADSERFSTGEDGHGITFQPIVGNAVFWVNMHSNGTGDERTLHAGLPVIEGTKIGMNVWGIQMLPEQI